MGGLLSSAGSGLLMEPNPNPHPNPNPNPSPHPNPNQAFKYVYDYARHERNLSLVGGHTSELNFNSSNLSLAQYWAELPTSMVSLAELQEQSRVLDNTVRRMFADKFHHEKGYWHDHKATYPYP